MDPEEVLLEAEEGMEKAVNHLLHELSGLRTGKASTALVDGLDVEAYGVTSKLKALALINVPEPRLVVIQPFDASNLKAIEKAINESRIGITPSSDGRLIRLRMPELTQERRVDLSKQAKAMTEDGRVAIRASRRASLDKLKKAEKESLITEDMLATLEKTIQKLTDDYIAKVEKHLEAKTADIMRV